ncbi:uncharacterized protein [Drosophila takahashii]|uniref:uncharacterized protein n=1 Tax=Drosophila takahashii TaxID=29030 RepID=UPI003898E476
MASKWAHHLKATNTIKHSQNGYGENIYWASNGKLAPSDVVEAWYNEISLYNWRYPSYSKQTGHFTQVVWKGSTELGVGFAKRGKTIIVVCNYNPPGNYENEFRRNVALPRKIYRN